MSRIKSPNCVDRMNAAERIGDTIKALEAGTFGKRGAMEAGANNPVMPAIGVCEFRQIAGLTFSRVTGAQRA